MRDFDLPMYGPGKFEGQPACHAVVANVASCGGDGEDVDGVTFLRGSLKLSGSFADVTAETFNSLNADEREYLSTAAGFIVDERDEQGFVTVERFDNADDFEAAMACEEARETERLNEVDSDDAEARP